jgi:hypothetical protein
LNSLGSFLKQWFQQWRETADDFQDIRDFYDVLFRSQRRQLEES